VYFWINEIVYIFMWVWPNEVTKYLWPFKYFSWWTCNNSMRGFQDTSMPILEFAIVLIIWLLEKWLMNFVLIHGIFFLPHFIAKNSIESLPRVRDISNTVNCRIPNQSGLSLFLKKLLRIQRYEIFQNSFNSFTISYDMNYRLRIICSV
jgi:hypothetical protein